MPERAITVKQSGASLDTIPRRDRSTIARIVDGSPTRFI
jgi:hypothetical protein